MQRENINRENYDFFFSNDKVYEYCLFCLLITTFLEKKKPHSFSILLLLQILIFVHINSFSVVKIGSEQGEKKNTRKKDIYVVIYAKHKIFVDKMFNIFVRHS